MRMLLVVIAVLLGLDYMTYGIESTAFMMYYLARGVVCDAAYAIWWYYYTV